MRETIAPWSAPSKEVQQSGVRGEEPCMHSRKEVAISPLDSVARRIVRRRCDAKRENAAVRKRGGISDNCGLIWCRQANLDCMALSEAV